MIGILEDGDKEPKKFLKTTGTTNSKPVKSTPSLSEATRFRVTELEKGIFYICTEAGDCMARCNSCPGDDNNSERNIIRCHHRSPIKKDKGFGLWVIRNAIQITKEQKQAGPNASGCETVYPAGTTERPDSTITKTPPFSMKIFDNPMGLRLNNDGILSFGNTPSEDKIFVLIPQK